MSLSVGARLGPYEVTAQIGAGGMGEVYRATDTQLGRDVALKILPDAFTGDADRLARFQREAQVLASLNHPGIAAIYGVHEEAAVGGGSFRALVLELVDGPTLADRIARGPIRLEETLTIATQIAEALRAAHDAGVVHRDLKPANIKLRPDGTVKVLDFGLAKAVDVTPPGDATRSPTITAAATQLGVILGTAAYMSPEQASGQAADHRSDIWSFGVVLFEMLTGHGLFAGDTVSHVLAKVLDRDIDYAALPHGTPAPIRRLLRRCLERTQKRRLADLGETLVHLEEAAAEPAGAVAEDAGGSLPGRGLTARVVPWVAGVTAGALIAGGIVWSLTRPPARPVSRFAIAVEGLVTAGLSTSLALSPDGRTLVYAAFLPDGVTRQLYQRPLDRLDATPIRGTESAQGPFFSPDGTWLGFWAIDDAALEKVALSGGPPATLTRVTGFRGADWGPDGTIVFAGGFEHRGLWLVADSGGAARQVAEVTEADGELRYVDPQFLPDGGAVLFTIVASDTPSRLAVLSLDTGERTILTEGNSARYASSGHLLFTRDDSLWAAPFDPARRVLTGAASPVLEGVQTNIDGTGRMALAADGSLVYVTGLRGAEGSAQSRRLLFVDRAGRETVVVDERQRYEFPRLSPDGTSVAVSIEGETRGRYDLWVLDVTRRTRRRMTFGTAGRTLGIWTPDGTEVTFAQVVGTSASYDLYRRPADSSAAAEPLLRRNTLTVPGAWTPDGSTLVFSEVHPTTNGDLWLLPDTGEPAPLVVTPFQERAPALSPDGRWLAHTSNESGADEVYVRPFPGPGGTALVSVGGGQEPVWSPAGGELFYRQGRSLMSVAVDLGVDEFRSDAPVLLFEGDYARTPISMPNYDVTRDGQRFLMLGQPDPEEAVLADAETIVVVQNWFTELERLVPTER